MPEFVSNTIEIIDLGKSSLIDVLNTIRNEKNVFDFNRIIPMPKDIGNGDRKWRMENWESATNAHNVNSNYVDVIVKDDDKIISFVTAWVHPRKLIYQLSKLCPDVLFYVKFIDYYGRSEEYNLKDGFYSKNLEKIQKRIEKAQERIEKIDIELLGLLQQRNEYCFNIIRKSTLPKDDILTSLYLDDEVLFTLQYEIDKLFRKRDELCSEYALNIEYSIEIQILEDSYDELYSNE